MATAAQIRAAIDTRLATLATRVEAYQAARLAAGARRCRQILGTHDVVPADGATAPTRPAIVSEWAEIGATLPPDLEVQLAVHEYEGPLGVGWQLEARVVLAGRSWLRVIHSGPETWRARAWARED